MHPPLPTATAASWHHLASLALLAETGGSWGRVADAPSGPTPAAEVTAPGCQAGIWCPGGTELRSPPHHQQGKGGHSRASFLWDLGGVLVAPVSLSPGAGTLSGLHPGPSAGSTESPPSPAGTGGSLGTAAATAFPRGSLELVGTALGGTLIPCPSGLGMLGIFSRLTTGTKRLAESVGRERGAQGGAGHGQGSTGGTAAHQRSLSDRSGRGCARPRAPAGFSRSALAVPGVPAAPGCPFTATWHLAAVAAARA